MATSIGIVGYGFVGQAVHNGIKNRTKTHIFDASNHQYNKFEDTCEDIINELDFLFVCLPTPSKETGEINISYLESFFEYANKIDYKGVIIIKSTVPYNYIFKYLRDNVVINPEFLNARSSKQDFLNQTYIILGGKTSTCERVKLLYKMHFTELKCCEITFELVTAEIAVNFKYMRNIKNALNVLYWNMIEDMTHSTDQLAHMLKNIPTDELSNIYQDGYRGYGGACLSKDVQAKLYETGHPFLQLMEDTNKILREKEKETL